MNRGTGEIYRPYTHSHSPSNTISCTTTRLVLSSDLKAKEGASRCHCRNLVSLCVCAKMSRLKVPKQKIRLLFQEWIKSAYSKIWVNTPTLSAGQKRCSSKEAMRTVVEEDGVLCEGGEDAFEHIDIEWYVFEGEEGLSLTHVILFNL